jgi:DNA-binding transcriptional regulator YiaG
MNECNACQQLTAPQRLRFVRTSLGYKQSAFKSIFGVSMACYYYYENVNFKLSQKQIDKLDSIGINPQYILFGNVSPFKIHPDLIRKNIEGLRD